MFHDRVGVLALLCFAAACERSRSEAPGVTATTIKIGSWGPLSGPAAAWSSVLYGMNAYFAYVNDRGGIHGRHVEFVFRDDQYSAAKTPGVARELVEKENVFAIVGGVGTAGGRAVADYLEEKGVPFFTPSSGDRYWTEPGKRNVYTVFPRYTTEGEILGRYIRTELRARTVTVLEQDDDFGRQGVEGLERGLGAQEGTRLVQRVSCLPTDTDLGGQVSRIIEAGADVLVIYAAPKQAVMAVKMLAAQKRKPQIVTSFVLSDPMMLELAGDAWDGTISSSVFKLLDEDDPSVRLYREVFERYGGGKFPAGTFTMAGFAFAMPFVEALDRAGRDLTREKLYRSLDELDSWNGGGPHWKGGGLSGPITFRGGRRLGLDRIFLIKAVDGKWVKVTDWLEL